MVGKCLPPRLERGIWDCKGEDIYQTHIRIHKAGIKISDVYGYKDLNLNYGGVV